MCTSNCIFSIIKLCHREHNSESENNVRKQVSRRRFVTSVAEKYRTLVGRSARIENNRQVTMHIWPKYACNFAPIEEIGRE